MMTYNAINHLQDVYLKTLCGISFLFYVMSYGLNFILYCATGKNFRREVICIFTRRPNKKKTRRPRRNNNIEMNNFEE